MSADIVKLNPLVFLDRIGRLYPYGVPQHLLVPRVIEQPQVEAITCLLIVLQQQKSTLRDELRALIEGICTKGLKLSVEECSVQVVCSEDYSDQILSDMIAFHNPKACVVFGSDVQPGRIRTSGETVTVYSYSLEQISHEATIKREFWKQLQENVLPVLQG